MTATAAKALSGLAVSTMAVLGAMLPSGAWSQAYPSKPLQMISAASLGSAADIALRLISARLAANLGQQVLVDTRGGGGGTIAANAVMRAPADGYTILFATPNILIHNRFVVKSPAYDSLKDFAPITQTIGISLFLALNTEIPATSVTALIDHAKRNPGKIAYGSTGVGAPTHLIGESLKIRTGIDMLHVPYSATGGSMTVMNDLAGGRVQIYFTTYSQARPYLAANDKIRILAVFEDARFKLAPNVPAISETLPGFQTIPAYYGLLGPLGLPAPIVERVSSESRRAMAAPDIAGKLEDLGLTVYGSSAEEFSGRMKKDVEYVGKLIGTLGIKPE